jgi:FixJ family two-component response regulator
MIESGREGLVVDENALARETVYIVDDDSSICESLSNLLEAKGMAACCFGSAEAFIANWQPERCGCLLLDARLPGMSGVEFLERMEQLAIRLPVVFMTAHGDMAMVRTVLKGGAIEFLIKPFQMEELLHALEQGLAFGRARRMDEQQVSSIETRIASLSERERQVMSMVTAGMLNKQIAAELGLVEITVKLHRRKVMERMRAESLAELVKLCERVRFVGYQPTRKK